MVSRHRRSRLFGRKERRDLNHEMHRRMEMWYNTHVSMNGGMCMSLRFAAGEVFGCIPHVCGAYAAAGNENYRGNLLW